MSRPIENEYRCDVRFLSHRKNRRLFFSSTEGSFSSDLAGARVRLTRPVDGPIASVGPEGGQWGWWRWRYGRIESWGGYEETGGRR